MYQHDQKCKQSFLFVHESAYEEDIMHILNRADKAPTALTAPLQTKRQTDRQTDRHTTRANTALAWHQAVIKRNTPQNYLQFPIQTGYMNN